MQTELITVQFGQPVNHPYQLRILSKLALAKLESVKVAIVQVQNYRVCRCVDVVNLVKSNLSSNDLLVHYIFIQEMNIEREDF